jgi:hypothetical protein
MGFNVNSALGRQRIGGVIAASSDPRYCYGDIMEDHKRSCYGSRILVQL